MSLDAPATCHTSPQTSEGIDDSIPKCSCCGRPLTIEDRLMNLEFLLADTCEQMPVQGLMLVDTMQDMVTGFRDLYGISDDE